MLNESGSAPGGVASSLSLLLATDSAREDVRRARSAICTSLNGLQRAAKLCCVLGEFRQTSPSVNSTFIYHSEKYFFGITYVRHMYVMYVFSILATPFNLNL